MKELKLKQSFDKYFEAPIEVWKSFVDLCNEVHLKKKSNFTMKTISKLRIQSIVHIPKHIILKAIFIDLFTTDPELLII